MAEYGTANFIDEAEAELYGLTTAMTGYITVESNTSGVDYVNVFYPGIVELTDLPRSHFNIVEFDAPIWDQP